MKLDCSIPTEEQMREQRVVHRWWRALALFPEEQTALRKCKSPYEASSLKSAHALHEILSGHDSLGVAALAALLAQIEIDDPETRFLCKLSAAVTKPAFSEFHFDGLSNCKTLEEIFVRLRQAIILLDRRVHVESLSECFLDWVDAHHPVFNGKPERAELLTTRWRSEWGQ